MTSNKSNVPIYVVGLPRSGTTWVASVLNSVREIKYFHEPFNKDHVPEAVPYWNKYICSKDDDPEFAEFCAKAFAGQIHRRSVMHKLSFPYRIRGKNLTLLPGRTMIKDVHSCLALDWIDRHVAPKIVIVVRHPCGLASSWFHLFKPAAETGKIKDLQCLLNQPRLLEDYLHPFESLLRSGEGFWQNVALHWGAIHLVMHEQQCHHPHWILVKHEDLCRDPISEFRKLFAQLNLRWTPKTENMLRSSTTEDSGKPYAPSRIAAKEVDKWKRQLESWQIEQIQKFVEPFKVPYYSE